MAKQLTPFERREISYLVKKFPGKTILIKFYPDGKKIDYHIMRSKRETSDFAVEKGQFEGFTEIRV